jgi:hypothetical protein
MERSYNVDVLENAIEPYRDVVGDFNPTNWLADRQNVMIEHDESVGLATFEYPGVYSVHWFFNYDHRGRKAINLARDMLSKLFKETDAEAIRGLTRTDLKAALWASRKVGMVPHGTVELAGHEYEVFIMTKKDFLNG